MRINGRTLQSYRIYPDITGRRFGHLLVMRLATKDEKPKDRYKHDSTRWWIARCDCGKTRAVPTGRLTNGSVKGCGCFGKKKGFGEAAKWQVFKMKMANANERGKSFTITFEEFLAITGSPCAYCGVVWSSEWPSAKRFNGTYRHNGIDRIDSSRGYETGNVAACCSTCNSAKGTKTIPEFKAWISRVHKHMALIE